MTHNTNGNIYSLDIMCTSLIVQNKPSNMLRGKSQNLKFKCVKSTWQILCIL